MCVLINICACRCVYSVCKRVTYTHGCDLTMLIKCIGVSDNNCYRSRHLKLFVCVYNYKSELIIMVVINLHHIKVCMLVIITCSFIIVICSHSI